MDYFRLYSFFLKKFYSPNPNKKLKVVFDCSNGTSGIVLEELFLKSKIKNQKSKFKFILINEKPDGNFPAHGPDPLKPGAVKQLQAAVKKNKADLGIIFDADGDRMFCIDDKSRFVEPDAIARLLVWQLKPKKIIIDVSTGWLVKKIKNQKSKIKIIESRVGHFFIKQKMRTENADFGAENSGHYYFKKFFGLDSGILAAIEVINTISKLPYRLSDFVELLPKYYHQEINIGLKQVKPANLLKTVEQAYQKEAVKISNLDGLIMEFPDWWFNLRFSQTEPLVRLNIETAEKSKLQEEVSKLKNYLN